MKIVIAGSMQFCTEMLAVAEQLRKLGHEPILSSYLERYEGKSPAEIEKLKLHDKYNDKNALIEYWDFLQHADALLVLNLDRHGIKSYIGGNAFLEMGFAFVLERKIFLWQDVPDMPYYGTEIIAMKPTVLRGDLARVQN